jgi:hypothetical protein
MLKSPCFIMCSPIFDRCLDVLENESIRSTLSTALGNDSTSIHQGDRLHPDAAAGAGEESAACCPKHSSPKALGPKKYPIK